MDQRSDTVSAEAAALHAALDEEHAEAVRRLAEFTNHELGDLARACRLIIDAISWEVASRGHRDIDL